MTSPPTLTLRVEVRPAPETNDHQVCLYGDGDDLLAGLDSSMIGMDPDDLLRPTCALEVGDQPREVTIGRCSCGVLECGSLVVAVERVDDRVTWSIAGRARAVFDADQYAAELARARADFSWETPDRTAGRLIADAVDRAHLREHGLGFDWASGRVTPGTMTISLSLEPGYQVLVQVPWVDTPEPTAQRCLAELARPPSSWTAVRWIPKAPGLAAPALAGPGWTGPAS